MVQLFLGDLSLVGTFVFAEITAILDQDLAQIKNEGILFLLTVWHQAFLLITPSAAATICQRSRGRLHICIPFVRLSRLLRWSRDPELYFHLGENGCRSSGLHLHPTDSLDCFSETVEDNLKMGSRLILGFVVATCCHPACWGSHVSFVHEFIQIKYLPSLPVMGRQEKYHDVAPISCLCT